MLRVSSFALAFAAALTATSQAGILGQASDYAILGLNGGTVTINSATVVTGDIGYSANVTSTINTKIGEDYLGQWTGTAYVHSTATFSYTAKDYIPSGGIITSPAQDARLNQANIDAVNMSNAFASYTPTHTYGNLGDDDSRDVVSTGAINVVQIGSLDYKTDSLTLTSRPGQSDVFIINVLGNFSFDQSSIVLANGTLASNVIFNFPNPSNVVVITKSATLFNGTILGPTASVEYHNPATFNGAIIARDINLHSDFNLNFTPFVPEPTSLSLLAVGALALLRRRR